jgi:hypothetical protein
MSTFNDIGRAYLKYAETRDWDKVTRGLIYTCNAGWLDLGHLDPTNTRPEIGAANLWGSVEREGPPLFRSGCDPALMRLPRDPKLAAFYAKLNCPSDDPYARFSDGSQGYMVRYRQDHGGITGRPGKERRYFIKFGLSRETKKSVALAIFMAVSHDFETYQSSWLARNLLTDSGYSAEDLVSNLIGFYIAIGAITKAEAIRLCHPVSRATAERIWQNDGAVGSNKNLKFEPHFFDSWYSDALASVCRDDCALTPRRFPEIFSTITPATSASHFLRVM